MKIRNKWKDISLRDVFKSLYYIEETHESTEGETITQSVDTSTLGFNNAGDITTYEDDYIRMTFDKGEGSTSPKYYTEGGFRFYNNNRIAIWTKEKVSLDYIRFVNSSSKYMVGLEYVSGTEFTSIDYNESTAVTTLSYDNQEVSSSTFVITNYTGDNTQCRVPNFEYRVVTEDSEYEVVVIYDDNPNMLYPMQDILGDYSECVNDTYITELFKRIYLRYADWVIFEYNEDIDNLETRWNKWLEIFTSLFISTKDRYEQLLSLYDSERNALLNPLKVIREASSSTTNKNRFNDTPQVSNSSGELEEDKYISQFSKGENEGRSSESTETDPATIMSRLDEIERCYRNVWKDWTDEFKSLFVPPFLKEGEDYD